MSEGAMAGVVVAVPPTEAREVIATCRAASGTAHASQSEGGEQVDGPALTIYIASCERLEELGYSVEERSAELEIMQLEDDSPYDGDVMVSPAGFLNLGAVPLNKLTVVMDVFVPCGNKKCAVRWCNTGLRRAAIGGRSVWWDGFAFPPGS
jgi:hypothetical protein